MLGHGTSTREALGAARTQMAGHVARSGRWVLTTRWRAQSRPPSLIHGSHSTAGPYTGSSWSPRGHRSASWGWSPGR